MESVVPDMQGRRRLLASRRDIKAHSERTMATEPIKRWTLSKGKPNQDMVAVRVGNGM